MNKEPVENIFIVGGSSDENNSNLLAFANILGVLTSPVLNDFRFTNSVKSPPGASFIVEVSSCVSVVSVLGGVSPMVPSTILDGSGYYLSPAFRGKPEIPLPEITLVIVVLLPRGTKRFLTISVVVIDGFL